MVNAPNMSIIGVFRDKNNDSVAEQLYEMHREKYNESSKLKDSINFNELNNRIFEIRKSKQGNGKIYSNKDHEKVDPQEYLRSSGLLSRYKHKGDSYSADPILMEDECEDNDGYLFEKINSRKTTLGKKKQLIYKYPNYTENVEDKRPIITKLSNETYRKYPDLIIKYLPNKSDKI